MKKHKPSEGWADEETALVTSLRSEVELMRRALERVRDFPYVGARAAQQMALIAGEALAVRQGERHD